jgi:hypothetical protein
VNTRAWTRRRGLRGLVTYDRNGPKGEGVQNCIGNVIACFVVLFMVIETGFKKQKV